MKRGLLPLLVAVLASLLVFSARSDSPNLLRDSDTAVLLNAIQERNNALSWFVGDWPLENHFYRPVVTLLFEADHALFGSNASGYGRTNALLAAGCVLLTFFFVRSWTHNGWQGSLAAIILCLWLVRRNVDFELPVALFGGLVWALSLIRQATLLSGLLAFGGIWLIGEELQALAPLRFRIVEWLPGRTASCMTVFALLSATWFVIGMRSRPSKPQPASAIDVPATKSTAIATTGSKPGVWIASAVCLLAALGSYEQAVVVPFLLIGAWWWMRRTHNVGSAWLIPVACLAAYLAVRLAWVPLEASGYQAQQYRSGPGVAWSILDYLLPGLRSLNALHFYSEGWPHLLLTPGFLQVLITGIVGTVLFVFLAVRYRQYSGFWLWPASVVAFLPMAWLKPFEHYHLLPMVFRAGFLAWLIGVVGGWVASAISPRPIQAPRRSDPAPGSLPRP